MDNDYLEQVSYNIAKELCPEIIEGQTYFLYTTMHATYLVARDFTNPNEETNTVEYLLDERSDIEVSDRPRILPEIRVRWFQFRHICFIWGVLALVTVAVALFLVYRINY